MIANARPCCCMKLVTSSVTARNEPCARPGKMKVQFDGIYHTLAKSVNMGSAFGEATIEGNVAVFVPSDTQGCKITMTFLPGKLVVKQDGDDATSGFGHNVYSTGTYKKIRSGKPKFELPI